MTQILIYHDNGLSLVAHKGRFYNRDGHEYRPENVPGDLVHPLSLRKRTILNLDRVPIVGEGIIINGSRYEFTNVTHTPYEEFVAFCSVKFDFRPE